MALSSSSTPTALLFPGQGSQSVGMLAALAARQRAVGECFEEASQALGYDLWQLVSQGPAEQLDRTEFTQPAMLAAGVATWRAWRAEGGPDPAVVAGHSLGEFSALVCAEVLAFDAALRLVRLRGQLMQRACPPGAGAMAAVLGLDEAGVLQVCREAGVLGVVETVNFNAPGQMVIAGLTAAVERAVELARARGAKRAVRLPVSVPAHSSLMRDAAEALSRELQDVALHAPRYLYVSAVDAAVCEQPGQIRAVLARQLASPVRWIDTVRTVLEHATVLIECGPGRVLTGLNRRIERSARALALEDANSLTAALAALRDATADA